MSGATEISNLVVDPKTPEMPEGPVEFMIGSKPTLSAVCDAAAIARDYKGKVWFSIGNDVYDARKIGEILESDLMKKRFLCTIEYDSEDPSSANAAKAAAHYIKCAFGGREFVDDYVRKLQVKRTPSWCTSNL